MLTPTSPLARLAASSPAARKVLLRHGLDFCCHGQISLADACAARALDPAQILREIARAPTDAPEFDPPSDPKALAGFIVERFHRHHLPDLDNLVAAARKVERVHAAHPRCPVGLAEALATLRTTLAEHMAKEEKVLFPAVKQGMRGPALRPPVEAMMREHDGHGDALATLRSRTDGFSPPPGACPTWRGLYQDLARFEEDLTTHVFLENHRLFPAIACSA